MTDVLEYDVVVLGGGSAGTMAARTAQQSGAKTVMINDGELGGLCILRGCMPTKTILHAAHLVHEAAHHHTPGIGRAKLEIDFRAVMQNKDAKVQRFKKAKIAGIERAGYDVVDARASFVGADLVEAGGRRFRFRKGAVIATGSVPFIPKIAGLDTVPYWTSDDVMRIEEQPRSLAIVGSGAIGLEIAQFFARMGTQVTLISRRPVFADAGSELVEEMAEALAAEPNLESLAGWNPVRFSRNENGIAVDCAGPDASRTVEVERLLIATGRKAAFDSLGLEIVGVQTSGPHVVKDEAMRTTNPNIFVAGDVSGERQLLHVANWEGKVAGLGAAQVADAGMVERRLHMEAVFTDPPMATIGMNAQLAEAAGHDVVVAIARSAETGRAITMDTQHGVMKLIAVRRDGEILGAQILGPRADDIVHVVSSIMYYRGTAAQMLEMPWYHPTLSEVLLQLAREIDDQVRAAAAR